MIVQAHEVHPSAERDWTIHEGEWEMEKHDRQIRDCMIKHMLTSGRSVQYRSSGSSLKPVVYSGDVTMWEPVTDHSTLVVGDIVFCHVQDPPYAPRFYGHAIHHIGEWSGQTYWVIGNLKDPIHINGWCYAEHIYGVLFEVSGIQPGNNS